MLSSLTIPLLGAVDIAMMGHTNSPTMLASIAIGAMLFDFLFWGFGFLRMSTTGLIAQTPKDNLICRKSLIVASTLGLLLILFQNIIYEGALFFFNPSPQIESALASYFYIRIYAAIPTLCNYVIIGYLFGRQNTKVALYLVVATNLLAIALDFMLVHYYMLSIKGLGIASVLAQTLGTLFGLLYLHHHYQVFKRQTPSSSSTVTYKRLFNINRDIFIRTCCLLITFVIFTRESAKLGPIVLAANTILLNFQQIMAYALDGFTVACETLVGKAYGEKNIALLKNSIKTCGVFCFSLAIGFSLLFLFFGDRLITLMSSLTLVQVKAHALLIWIVILPLISVGSFVLDGIFIGATWTKEMRTAMLLSSLVFLISCYILLPFHAHGLWAAFCIFMLSRFIFLLARLNKKLLFFNII
jgi:MATE family multidrug resistance protein